MWAFMFANTVIIEFMINSVVALFLAGVFYKLNESGLPLCTNGE